MSQQILNSCHAELAPDQLAPEELIKYVNL